MGADAPTAERPPGRDLASPGDQPSSVREAIPVFFRHPSPWILSVSLGFAALMRLRAGPFGPWDLVPVAALLVLWPVIEWLIHVFVLHYRPMKVAGRTLDFDLARKHRAHHRDPWRPDLIFIPARSFVWTLPGLLALWWAITPGPALMWTGITATFALALHYEMVHFGVHTRIQPRLAYYRRLWRNHRLHHFKNEHYWYGVTRTAGDWLLRTQPDQDAVDASPTARALHGMEAA